MDGRYLWKRFIWGRTCNSRKQSERIQEVLEINQSPGVDGILIELFQATEIESVKIITRLCLALLGLAQ